MDRVHDLKLRDIEGNGRMEIVIAADSYYDGVLEIYRFDSNNTFTRVWTTRRARSAIHLISWRRRISIIMGHQNHCGQHSRSHRFRGCLRYAYDYPSGTESWRSVNLASGLVASTASSLKISTATATKRLPRLLALATFTLGMADSAICATFGRPPTARC